MHFTEESLKQLGDKDVVHYYEVLLLEEYWGKGNKEQLQLLEEEVVRRGVSPETIRQPLLERAPKLDEALENLWAGKLQIAPKVEDSPSVTS